MTLQLFETHGCQGGAHAGYTRAGWSVTGNDIEPNHAKYYPGPLIIGDAATVIREAGHEFDARHSSPPCQWYTRGNAQRRGQVTRWDASDRAGAREPDQTWEGLFECLPPAYTEWIGGRLRENLLDTVPLP